MEAAKAQRHLRCSAGCGADGCRKQCGVCVSSLDSCEPAPIALADRLSRPYSLRVPVVPAPLPPPPCLSSSLHAQRWRQRRESKGSRPGGSSPRPLFWSGDTVVSLPCVRRTLKRKKASSHRDPGLCPPHSFLVWPPPLGGRRQQHQRESGEARALGSPVKSPKEPRRGEKGMTAEERRQRSPLPPPRGEEEEGPSSCRSRKLGFLLLLLLGDDDERTNDSLLFLFYLVDPASSHMLVSKIKPCMCKYRPT